jgi:hypothetical protein
MVCQPRFDCARATPTAERTGDGVRFIAGGGPPLAFLLRSIPVRIVDGAVLADFTLRADESASFSSEQVEPGWESPSGSPDYVAEAFKRTVNFWRGWVGRSTYRGRWRGMVNRSTLTLKLLTSRPFGSTVAAPTFGLPERVGGGRNWDYRNTWIQRGLVRLQSTGSRRRSPGRGDQARLRYENAEEPLLAGTASIDDSRDGPREFRRRLRLALCCCVPLG